jgi:hypothetical protein
MFDHTHVHSCFGIHSPFDLRISSFTQAFGFLPIPPGIHRDAGTTQRDRAGLIGTALGPEKDGFLSPLADTLATHNHFANSLLCLRPSKAYPSEHLLSACLPQPSTPARSTRCHGVISGRFWTRIGGAFLNPVHHPQAHNPFPGKLLCQEPPHHPRQTFSSSRRRQPRPPLPLALRSWLRRPICIRALLARASRVYSNKCSAWPPTRNYNQIAVYPRVRQRRAWLSRRRTRKHGVPPVPRAAGMPGPTRGSQCFGSAKPLAIHLANPDLGGNRQRRGLGRDRVLRSPRAAGAADTRRHTQIVHTNRKGELVVETALGID